MASTPAVLKHAGSVIRWSSCILSVCSQPFSVPGIPPGSGKPSTQSRNRRRRVKKKYDQQAARETDPKPPPCISYANSYPLDTESKIKKDRNVATANIASAANNPLGTYSGTGELDPRVAMNADSAAVVTSQAPLNEGKEEVMMSKLRNKNKKKGFKQAMVLLPPKIVFSDSDAPRAQNSVTNATSPQMIIDAPARLAAPSEKQERGELPSRMFVTCADVEKNLMPRVKKSNKSNRRHSQLKHESCFDASVTYGEDVSHVTNSDPTQTSDFTWDLAEKHWDTFEEVTRPEQLQVGCSVSWKVCFVISLVGHIFTHSSRSSQ
jgi:hypothetical protein